MSVRVRIAPSPTGSPHVGTAYIGLFNYCFAKSQEGSFILRIEDTDQLRSKKVHETTILDALRWTGLSWDEGPDIGGPYGPYRQSERSEIYREHALKLLESGAAYKCFCSPERLASIREQQRKAGGIIGYDGCCLKLDADQVAANERSGVAYVVRLKVPESGPRKVFDVLRGEIEFNHENIDHQILMKSDGFPTYHMANVVDDHLMKITHVIRGEEWLSSLPKHSLLYEAFGWDAPLVIHLPLLRNDDGSKLSKRKNPTSILFFKETGILPETLLNFLGLMAYTLPARHEIFSLQEMLASFNIERVHQGGPIFDPVKLRWLNQQHIAGLDGEALLQRLLDWRFNADYLRRLVPMMQKRLFKLGDLIQICDFMFVSEVDVDTSLLPPKKRSLEEARDFLQLLVWEFETVIDFNAEQLEAAIKKTGSIEGWNLRDACHVLRVAISGKTVAPPLFDTMSIMGSDVVRNRMMTTIAKVQPPNSKKKLKKMSESYTRASLAYVQEERNT